MKMERDAACTRLRCAARAAAGTSGSSIPTVLISETETIIGNKRFTRCHLEVVELLLRIISDCGDLPRR